MEACLPGIGQENLSLSGQLHTPAAACEQAAFQGSEHFLIPFDQQQLADYLCVERSGLSVALNRLRREGVIRYRKNRFSLCTPLEEGEPKKEGR